MTWPQDAAAKVDYRLYSINDKGHIFDVRLIKASGDAKAWERTGGIEDKCTVELWCRDRQVAPPSKAA